MGAVSSSLHKGHRYPPEIISHCVWRYHRLPLSLRVAGRNDDGTWGHRQLRDAPRGCEKFGQTYANGLHRRRAPTPRFNLRGSSACEVWAEGQVVQVVPSSGPTQTSRPALKPCRITALRCVPPRRSAPWPRPSGRALGKRVALRCDTDIITVPSASVTRIPALRARAASVTVDRLTAIAEWRRGCGKRADR